MAVTAAPRHCGAVAAVGQMIWQSEDHRILPWQGDVADAQRQPFQAGDVLAPALRTHDTAVIGGVQALRGGEGCIQHGGC
jgi:hypothetical protein